MTRRSPVRLRARDYEAVESAIVTARQQGISLADALDIDGLLLTEKRLNQAHREALVVLRTMLERESAEGLVRWRYGKTHPVTPKDMFDTVQSWLEMSINLAIKDLEDAEQAHHGTQAVA